MFQRTGSQRAHYALILSVMKSYQKSPIYAILDLKAIARWSKPLTKCIYHHVLERTRELTWDSLWSFNPELVGYHFLTWAIVFMCIMKGIKSSGKVVYVSAVLPYLLIIALLIKGLTLEGAKDGLYYAFVPKWEKLLEFRVWERAAQQTFFSLGLSMGGLVTMSSFNSFHNNFTKDVVLIGFLDLITSIIMSCAIFSILGHLSYVAGIPIEKVAEAGQGLIFVVIPEAIETIAPSWFWSASFFAMIFFLGVDSQFVQMEGVMKVIFDKFTFLAEHKVVKQKTFIMKRSITLHFISSPKVSFLVCLLLAIIGLPCVSNGGAFVIDLMDNFLAGVPLLCLGAMEIVSLAWIYGFKNMCNAVKAMVGHEPGLYIRSTWVFFCPAILLLLTVTTLISFFSDYKYAGVIAYPGWALIPTKIICMLVLLIPPGWLIKEIMFNKTSNPWNPTGNWACTDRKAEGKEVLESV